VSVYWNSRTKNLSPYIPGEQPKDRRFIKLNTNENPYPPSPKVIEAIQKAANTDLRLYPDPECTEFREAVAARFSVKIEQVFAGNGSDEILAFAFGAFFESAAADFAKTGSEKTQPILFPDITYSFYPVYAGLWDIPFKVIPLCEDFTINIEDYKIQSGGVVFPNPNAPTGIALSAEDLLSLSEFLAKKEKVFIVDEAYIAFSGDKSGSLSAAAHINGNPNLLTVHTLSKSASLAGLRAGFAIGNEKLIEGLCRIRDSFNSYTMDRLALAGAAAAVKDTAYYDDINSRVIATRERITQSLSKFGFIILPSASNFIFIKASNINAAELFTTLREKGILVRHFNKERIKDYLRVSIGTDEDMDALLDICEKITRGER
jgi:histidinol-phosphate aminotransferase